MSAVDLAAESRRPRLLPWLDVLSRAVGFELAGALTYQDSDPEHERMVRAQHILNAQMLDGYMTPSRN